MIPLPAPWRSFWSLLTLKHGIFAALCLGAFQVHLAYRVPSRFLFLALPWIGVVLGVLSLTVLVNHSLSRAAPDHPYRRVFARIDRWATRLVLAFLGVSALLALNGALDDSPVTERRAAIVDVVDADVDLGVRVSYAWAALRWGPAPERVERVLLGPGEFELLWAGRPVVVKTRRGYLRIAWVTEIEPDWERQQRAIVAALPTAVQAWRNLSGILFERRRLVDASAAIQEYLRLYPEAYDDARMSAAEFAWAGLPAEVVAILEPFASRRPDYEIYDLYGFALARVGRAAEGTRWLRRAIALAPARWEAYYHLGTVLADVGDAGGAAGMFAKTLERRPDFPEVRRRLARLRGT